MTPEEILTLPAKHINMIKRQFEAVLPAGAPRLPDLPEALGELPVPPVPYVEGSPKSPKGSESLGEVKKESLASKGTSTTTTLGIKVA